VKGQFEVTEMLTFQKNIFDQDMLQPTNIFALFPCTANMVYDSSQAGVHTVSVNKLEPDDVYSVPNEAQAPNTTRRGRNFLRR